MQLHLTLHEARQLTLATAKIANFITKSPNTANIIGIDNQTIKQIIRINEKLATQVAQATEEYYPNTVDTHSNRQ